EVIKNVREDVVNEAIDEFIPPQSLSEMWNIEGLERQLAAQFAIELPVQQWLDEDSKLYEETIRERILAEILKAYEEKEAAIGAETMRQVERQMMLQVLDNLWKEHLATMDHLRQGIHLRGYGQKNPKQEYKRESFGLFQELLNNIKHDTIRVLSHIRIRREEEVKEEEERRRLEAEAQLARAQFQHEEAGSALGAEEAPAAEDDGQAQPFVRDGEKVGRNDPCPCGSGKKYKHCHGQLS
ncbi:MAG: SEC-C metal-binding domain-containing protein, partial [Thalassolituus sp.]